MTSRRKHPWSEVPDRARQRILHPRTFRERHFKPNECVGIAIAGWLEPAFIGRLDIFSRDHPIFLLVPSYSSLTYFSIDERFHKALQIIPWWQRVGLAASLRNVQGVVPIFRGDPRAWKTWIIPATWLDWLDPPSILP